MLNADYFLQTVQDKEPVCFYSVAFWKSIEVERQINEIHEGNYRSDLLLYYKHKTKKDNFKNSTLICVK